MSALSRDGVDDWVQVRDKRLSTTSFGALRSPGVIGYQDLDGYGRWVPTPNYGNVWIPSTVPAGWAPYRFGHWVWIAPWGWTWVDDQPWGFAPVPLWPLGFLRRILGMGSLTRRATGILYYSPALVGWIGAPGFGVGFWIRRRRLGYRHQFPGWFPLGWGELFYPRYCGWGYGVAVVSWRRMG